MAKLSIHALSMALSGVAMSSAVVAAPTHHIEQNGSVVIEAEHFASQHLDAKRRWLVFDHQSIPHPYADADPIHSEQASNGAYIELLPDTRVNHHETLILGENFSAEPGQVAVLSYPVYFANPGKYYVWARAFSTGSEDNGLHIGLNGQWPESGQRLQLCDGKDQWTWSSAQRVPDNHCGEPHTISVQIETAGVHNVMLSMREDGFELDKLILSNDANFTPEGVATAETLSVRPALPKKQLLRAIDSYKRALFASSDFDQVASQLISNSDKQQIAVDTTSASNLDKFHSVSLQIGRKDTGHYPLTLVTLSEGQAQSRYLVKLNDTVIGEFTNPKTASVGAELYFHIPAVTLNEGDRLEVASMARSDQPSASQGRWRALVVVPH
ncbi:hypothetical protein IC617_04260 [Neiella sp. HB171785]|uniref:Gylcosyl hydrolase 115 C-terminal domain-containing protein n=1 Tax=Neiella litorisoli TaxID=2771431 RepID=A0A8J6UDV8_9GAMM|nr:hypothetical protein [Neiella litorisoli]MBD1388634.1 hypothetical protein [Neiella litorisoli]